MSQEFTTSRPESFKTLAKVVEGTLTHRDYARTVELSQLYRRLITGKEVEALLFQFNPREDAVAFEQRKKLTKATTPAVCASLMKPFYKVPRTDRVVKRIVPVDDQSEAGKAAVGEVQTKLDGYYGSQANVDGLDYFLQSRFMQLTFTDPNAFIVTEFAGFDYEREKASPYPFIVPAESAVYFDVVNNSVTLLIVREGVKFVNHDKNLKALKNDGFKYTLYDEQVTIVLTQLSSNDAQALALTPDGTAVVKIGGKNYSFREYAHKTGVPPIARVGYKEDLETDGRTYVNPFHEALCYLEGSVKDVSEFDLTKCLHTFPQKLQYVAKCGGESDMKPCRGGFSGNGIKCKKCKGSGYAYHTSAQDIILLPLPESKDEMLPLDQMLVYKSPPIELLTFQKELVEAVKENCHQTVFNTSVLVQTTVVKTATEKDQDIDSVYDTLSPFAEKVSAVWLAIADIVARVTDNDQLVEFMHRFPTDFKMKTRAALYAELKVVNDSYAPSFVVEAINDDLAAVLFQDEPDQLLKYQVKKQLFPFRGKDPDEIARIVLSDYTPKWKKVLYTNFEDVMSEAERRDDTFYVQDHEAQVALIKTVVDEVIEEISAGQPKVEFIPIKGGRGQEDAA